MSPERSTTDARDWSCREFGRVIGPYLDGALDPIPLGDAEAHVACCERCRERVALNRATRGSLQSVVKATAPVDFRARVASAMAAEAARGDAQRKASLPARSYEPWRGSFPLAAAAAVGLLFVSARDGGSRGNPSMMRAGLGDDMLSELVAEHARPLPPEQTEPSKVRALEAYVGVPVRPIRFTKNGARFVGGRVLPVHHERAAMLQYEMGSGGDLRRVSVFIYDPMRIQVNGEDLAPRAVGTASVRVGREQGYSVAVTQQGGVGYAIASDMDPERSAQLAAMFDDSQE